MKHYVLDTCVLLHDPNSLTAFQEHSVYLPLVVIEELDKFKKEENEKGRNARAVTRLIDELRTQGPLTSHIKLPSGGDFRVLPVYSGPGQLNLDFSINDNKILSTAAVLKERIGREEVILVSNDINMRVRANIMGIPVEPFGKKAKAEDSKEEIKSVFLNQYDYASFKQHGHIAPSEAMFNEAGFVEMPKGTSNLGPTLHTIHPNEFVRLVNIADPSKSAYAVYVSTAKNFQKIRNRNDEVFGIIPKNDEQACALDALMDPDIPLVTLNGKAGSGKTLIAIAAALEATLEHKMYDKILIARPVQPMGKDIGYLPGTLEEKLSPWMQPIFDNLEFLFHNKKKNGGVYESVKKQKTIKERAREAKEIDNFNKAKAARMSQAKPVYQGANQTEKPKNEYDFLLENGTIKVEALTYIRGRSIPKQFIIIDEAQNLTPHEVKTIITRAGEGTKIILTGDIEQIDSPYLDEVSNGLTYAVQRLKSLPITSHVTLFECERSALAEAGTKYL